MKPIFLISASLGVAALLAVVFLFDFESDEDTTLDPQASESALEGPRRGGSAPDQQETPQKIPWLTMTRAKTQGSGDVEDDTWRQLVDGDENPICGALIVPFQAGKWGKLIRTRDDGRFPLPVPEEDGWLAVAPPESLPQMFPLHAGRAPKIYRLQAAPTAGILVDVDGKVPEKPLTLVFTPLLTTFVNLARLSAKDARALYALSPRFRSWEAHTDRNGRIAVGRILAKESFRIGFPAGLGLKERLQVDFRVITLIPGEEGTLHLKTRPHLRGRLLQAGSLAPVSGARVSVVMPTDDDEAVRIRFSGLSDDEGLFDIELGASVARDVTMEFGPGAEAEPLPLSGPFEGVRDLGDLLVTGARPVVVHVVDAEGKPVPGARAISETDDVLSPASDEQGRITWPACPVATRRIQVAALGFAPSWAILQDDETPIEVRLTKSNRLRVLVTDEKHRPIPDLTTRLEFSRMPFLYGSEGYPSSLCTHLMGFPPLQQAGQNVYDNIRRKTDEEGRVEWGWLRPDVQVTVTVFDALNRVLAMKESISLGSMETRDLVFELKPNHARAVKLVVKDSDGMPASNVLVKIRPVRKRAPSFSEPTDARGTIQTPVLLMAAPVAIEVFRYGEAIASIESFILNGSDLELALPR